MTRTPDAAPEMSRPLALEKIGPQGAELAIEATAEERAALAARFGLVRIDDLRASVGLEWVNGGRLRLKARIEARVVQTCVVSLDDVENTVDETVEILFETPDGAETAREVVLEASDDAEPMPGDPIDLGEIIAEEFALSLDPYPRRPDMAPVGESEGDPSESPVQGPFQDLARLKRDL